MFLRNTPPLEDVKQKSDEEILAISIRHPAVFERLVERYQSAFLRKAVRIMGNKDDAEDAVQEAFIKIYKNAHLFQKHDGTPFRSWAYTVLINVCLSSYRKKERVKSMSVDVSFDILRETIPDTVDVWKEKEVRGYIDSIFSKMPASFSSILRLHFLEGWKYAELAAMEGVSVGTIKARVSRAKREFRKLAAGF